MITHERSIATYPTTTHPGAVLAELRDATKRFGAGVSTVEAVSGVDLTVRAGELLAVLGPNGAGKTTAISMLTGLRRPTSGKARLFGRDPRDLAARQRVGVMLQDSGVPETLRVRELLNEFRGYYPDPLPLASVIAAAGLDGLERRLYGELSGGQRRRVLFAIAVCGNPELLFFDEPTSGLDVEVRRGLWSTLRGLTTAGAGVVLTTHYLEEADALADRIVVLTNGRVIAEGSPSAIKALIPGGRIRAQSSVSAAEAGALPGVQRASRDGEWLELLTARPEPVLRELMARDPAIANLTVVEPSLEDAFVALTITKETAA
jgi:ABC-2 type transport system ATP-binding protein